ncbi:ATP-binding protein [Cellulomonas sp. URHD0024]|uniref:ATP-binding protein n=1 Tax=Cellulomonas sp. URHD0024 TaxID=1302620 RepID=UPI000416053C|nr:ATP-binding protein [Cellulomonas sp. URHD0024]
MTGRRPASITQLLRRGFAGVIGLLILGGTVGVIASVVVSSAGNDQLAQIFTVRTANLDVRRALTDAELGMDDYLLTGAPSTLERMSAAERAYHVAIDELRRVSFPEDRAYVEDLVDTSEAWWDQLHVITGAPPNALPVAEYTTANALYAEAFEASVVLDERVTARGRTVVDHFAALNRYTVGALVGLTAAGILATVVIATHTGRRIRRPLAAITGVLDQHRHGDYDARIDLGGMPLEIADMAATANKRADELAQERRLDDDYQRLSVELRQRQGHQELLERAVAAFGELFPLAGVTIATSPDPMSRVVTSSDLERPGQLGPGTPTDTATAPPASAPDAVDRPLEASQVRASVGGRVLVVPIADRSAILGTVTLVEPEGHAAWQRFEIQFAERLTADLGRALARARLVEQEQELVSRLQELDATRTEFISNISHELRSPLTSIRGYTELLIDEDAGPVTPQQRTMLGTMERNIERLQAMIENLLTMSRIELGAEAAELQAVDLGAIVAHTRSTFEPAADKAGLTLTYEVRRPLTVDGDQQALDRLVINLVSNAIKFTPRGGTVAVSLDSTDTEAVLVVEDTGIGIPATDQDKVFGRFYRSANARGRAIAGTGIGLAIVASMVEQHLGTVSLASEEGRGTRVTVRLPLLERPEPAHAASATERR